MANIPDIEYIKTINVTGYINATDNFTTNIDVEFIPDVIKLKFVTYNNQSESANPFDPMYLLKSTLIDNHTLLGIPAIEVDAQWYDVSFRNFKQIGGTYNFSLSNINGGQCINIGNIDIYIVITFEFIKYDKKK